jgi:hypothetical protein
MKRRAKHRRAKLAERPSGSVNGRGDQERVARKYSRCLRFGECFTVVDPPRQWEVEEACLGWLPSSATPVACQA